MAFRQFSLPAHYVRNQVEAIRGRFKLGPTDPIPECALYMIFCPICDRVYSMYNGDKKQVRNPADCFGYNYVTHDVHTGDLYCNRESVIAHADFKVGPCAPLQTPAF